MTVSQEAMAQDTEYESILGAVMETPRGRWFIEEFTRRNRTADTNELLSAINALQTTTRNNLPETSEVLRRELQEMSASIHQTRAEITAIKPDGGDDNQITDATGQLNAILVATEQATSEILSSAEQVQEISEKLREQGADEDICDELESHATGIFMACSFQDITGQRTTKVVKVLQYLEHRIDSMIQIWGTSTNDTAAPVGVDDNGLRDTRPDADLLNGPQLDEEVPSQNTIDDIFAQSPDTESPDASFDVTDSESTDDHVDLDDLGFAENLTDETAG